MKKKWVILIIILFIVILGICVIFFLPEKTEELELSIPVYEKHKISEYQDKITCKILEDKEIKSDKVGDSEISARCKFDYIKGKLKVKIHTIDTKKPILILKDTMTVTEGYEKKLEEVIVSMDNYDNNPKREVIGDYDVNKVGTYPLHYKVTDSSGNIEEKDFTLNVIAKNNNTSNRTNTNFSDVLKNYKNENNEIGIDVSKWQGLIDFEKVKNAGASFVMIRLGYQSGYDGNYVIDPYFKQNIENAKVHGLKVGVYFYSYAKTKKDIDAETKWIIDNLKGIDLDLPVSYDWENWSTVTTLKLNLVEFNAMMKTFMKKIKESGYDSMLYSSKNFLEQIWETDVDYIWLAHYIDKTNYEGKYHMWQLCENGKIDGIKGNVDIDILYK